MGNTCTICPHPQVRQINKELIRGTPFRTIAKKYGVGWQAARRHKQKCLEELADRAIGNNVDAFRNELNANIVRLGKMIRAAEDWLQDPDNPEEYTLDPRASDVNVVYLEQVDGKIVKEKASLQVLLDRISKHGMRTGWIVIKRKDPVDTFIQAAREYRAYCESVLNMLEGGASARVEVVLRALPMMKPKGAGE